MSISKRVILRRSRRTPAQLISTHAAPNFSATKIVSYWVYEQLARLIIWRMRSFQAFVISALFLTTSTSHAQAIRPSVLLPRAEARSITRLCSREAPTKVDGSWEPTKADLEALESRIPEIASLSGWRARKMGDPRSFYRQYVAINVQGRRLIYINALCFEKAPSYWREQLVNPCDGGQCFWGAYTIRAQANFLSCIPTGLSKRAGGPFVDSCGKGLAVTCPT